MENDRFSPPTPEQPRDVLAEAEREGIDLSLLRERLRLTPTERVERNEAGLSFVLHLREAGNAKRRKAAPSAS